MAIDIDADTHQEYLLKLLQSEIKHRETARRNKLLNTAGFYCRKSIDDFHFDGVTLPDAITPESLHDCDFIQSKTNIVMYGNVGTGKTHLSIALGVEACKRDIPTRFFRTAALVNQCKEKRHIDIIFEKDPESRPYHM